MRKTFILLSLFTLLLGAHFASAQNISLSYLPNPVIQGEALMLIVDGANNISLIKNMTFDKKKTKFFIYDDKITSIIGIDLLKKAGSYEFAVELSDGSIISSMVEIGAREKYEVPLGIPEKLGGDTKASQNTLVSTLAKEKIATSGLRTNKKTLWTKKFIPPLKEIYITDPYGFSRKTGEYSIPHKGVDYRAKDGTEVLATNRGVVRMTKTFRNYGKTVIIDHGQGLMSYYLHLSKIKVKVGDVVEQGRVIALSGHSGYTLGAHLHFAIRINDIGIDPVRFLEMWK